MKVKPLKMDRLGPGGLLRRDQESCKVTLPVGVARIESLSHGEPDVEVRVAADCFYKGHATEVRDPFRKAKLQLEELDAVRITSAPRQLRRY